MVAAAVQQRVAGRALTLSPGRAAAVVRSPLLCSLSEAGPLLQPPALSGLFYQWPGTVAGRARAGARTKAAE
jgi:hypothetical protein